MTPHQQETKRRAEVMLAYAEGKKIEGRTDPEEDWEDRQKPGWNWNYYDYRVKPEPATRPWAQEDVPPVCWIECHVGTYKSWHLVDAVRLEGIRTTLTAEWITYEALRYYSYSTDLKTWRKCEVEM